MDTKAFIAGAICGILLGWFIARMIFRSRE